MKWLALAVLMIAKSDVYSDGSFCKSYKQYSDYLNILFSDSQTLPITRSSESATPFLPLPSSNCTYQLTKATLSILISGSNCGQVPANPSFAVVDLRVQGTIIEKIGTDAFASWANLYALHLRKNPVLREISPGAFRSLSELVNLTITYNSRLEHLHEKSFEGLIKVRQLSLLGNGILTVGSVSIALSAQSLPSISFVDLRENNIPWVGEDEFLPMKSSPLKALILSSTQTEFIHKRAFDPLEHLERLVFTQNKLNGSVVGALIEHLSKINPHFNSLSVAANPLYEDLPLLLRAVAHSSITHLDISNNYFLNIQPGFFPPMPKLKVLDISNIMINNFPDNVINTTLMPELVELKVSRNDLRTLSTSLALPTLRTLDLSYTNNNNLAWNVVFLIDPEAFSKMPHLTCLNLGGTTIQNVSKNIFSNAHNLVQLSLQDASLSSIDRYSFANNIKLEYLDLSQNSFPIFTAMSKDLFKGLEGLIALDLSYCHITSFPNADVFFHLKKLRYLSLRMNAIYNIDGSSFNAMPSLSGIDLRYNTMVDWNFRLFKNNIHLREVLLDFNHLTSLSGDMLRDFSSANRVSLQGNTIACDCSLVSVVLDYTSKRSAFFDLLPFNQSSDRCNYPSYETIVEFLSNTAYSSKCQNATWQISVVVVVLLLALLIPLSYFIYRNYKLSIEFAYLTAKERLGLIKFRGRNVPLENLDGSLKDAFVSYSCEDESFVEKMVYILESEGFDLLLYKRDFNVGDIIPDKILESIESSRKTILVLSESFAKSQWCLWEMYIAQNRSICLQRNEQDPLLLIKKSDIEEAIMTPTLKHLLQTRVYLQWHDSPFRQKIFWQQLKIALMSPKPESKSNEVST